MLKEKVYELIKKYGLVQRNYSVLTGVSGGPDSVCLLHLLSSLSKDLEIKIIAAHVNHMLRGEESDRDQAYVEELCQSLGVPLHVKAFDIKAMAAAAKVSVEEAARDARYGYFNALADETGAEVIAVAHNRNDQAETILMNIIRGTGVEGLRGMEYRKGRIIRPLLGTGRSEIEQYCRDNSLSPVTDSTNLESLYTRNRVRLELIPAINGMFDTDLTDKLYRMSCLLKEDGDYLEDEAREMYLRCMSVGEGGRIRLKLEGLRGMHTAMRRRLVRNAVRDVKKDLKGIESIHIDMAERLVLDGRTGASVHLPSGVRAERSYDALEIFLDSEKREALSFEARVSVPGSTYVGEIEACLEAEVLQKLRCGNYGRKDDELEQFFDYEKLKSGINIRNRRNGDVFKPLRSNGTKKLKEYFIDTKVPRAERDEKPLVAHNNEVAWIIGHKTSDKFKVTDNTKSVLRLKYTALKKLEN